MTLNEFLNSKKAEGVEQSTLQAFKQKHTYKRPQVPSQHTPEEWENEWNTWVQGGDN